MFKYFNCLGGRNWLDSIEKMLPYNINNKKTFPKYYF